VLPTVHQRDPSGAAIHPGCATRDHRPRGDGPQSWL